MQMTLMKSMIVKFTQQNHTKIRRGFALCRPTRPSA